MYYSELVLKASRIMFQAHMNDTDKGGYPYVFHPFYLASQMSDEDAVCVALLHDVIEDHGDEYSFDDLVGAGFNSQIIHALKLLTHAAGVPYMDYIKAISADPLAKQVKIADLKHNLDSSRVNGKITPKHDTYIEALRFLESVE